MWIVFATFVAVDLCMLVNCTKEYMRKEEVKKLKWKYEIGDRIIYRQKNRLVDRYIGCKILEQRYFTEGGNKNKVCYRVLAYTEDKAIWTLLESDILCTDEQFESFPVYNKRGV